MLAPVDDTLTHRPHWEQAGGVLAHHQDVARTLAQLAPLFPLLSPD